MRGLAASRNKRRSSKMESAANRRAVSICGGSGSFHEAVFARIYRPIGRQERCTSYHAHLKHHLSSKKSQTKSTHREVSADTFVYTITT